eukprot:3746668-Pleurochrysis_carterae.AAC.2
MQHHACLRVYPGSGRGAIWCAGAYKCRDLHKRKQLESGLHLEQGSCFWGGGILFFPEQTGASCPRPTSFTATHACIT